MISYRITKFNPAKRNKKGHYLDDSEWTSISDIGKLKYNNVTFLEYESIENSYVDSVKIILDEIKINTLQIDSIELYNKCIDFKKFKNEGVLDNIIIDYNRDIKGLVNGKILGIIEIDKIIRLILRETIWMNLHNSNIKIIFGYDYYMYIECPELSQTTIGEIEKKGLFVEPNINQMEFIFVK